MKQWFCLGFLLLSQVVTAETIACKVVGLSDGDTFTCLDQGRQQHRVRLGNIDTPEKKQPYGSRARQELGKLIFSKSVVVEIQDVDRYGRSIGVVFLNGTNINREMVARGAAWVYPQYNRDPGLPELESEAKAARVGIWSLPASQAMPPWDWRRNARQPQAGSRPAAQRPVQRDEFVCGKSRCGEMTSCAEARFHLQHCAVMTLDGDKDGMPCERLCR